MSGFQAPRAFPVEEFVQSLTGQLDRAQALLAVKARAGVPLTFALKDLAIDLRVFWEADSKGQLLMRHAGPNEEGASGVKFSFTTITRSMAEENTMSLSLEDDPRPLTEVGGGESLMEDDRMRLERAGVRTVGQLRRLSTGTDPRSVEALIGIPVLRMQAALERAARPSVSGNEAVNTGRQGRRLLRIRGANLRGRSASRPEVRLAGEPVEVLEASDHEVVVRAMEHHRSGQLELIVDDDRTTGWFDFHADARERETGESGGDAKAAGGEEAPREPDRARATDGAEPERRSLTIEEEYA